MAVAPPVAASPLHLPRVPLDIIDPAVRRYLEELRRELERVATPGRPDSIVFGLTFMSWQDIGGTKNGTITDFTFERPIKRAPNGNPLAWLWINANPLTWVDRAVVAGQFEWTLTGDTHVSLGIAPESSDLLYFSQVAVL